MGRAWLGAAVLLARALLCWPVMGQRAGPGCHQSLDVTVDPQALCEDIATIHSTKGRWAMKGRSKRATKPGKSSSSIFSKRQVILWMVIKRRRFPRLCNDSLNQPRALQCWHLTGFGVFFQDKVLLFRKGSGKLERIPDISLMPKKVGTSNLLTLFFLEVKLHFLGHRPASYLGEAQLSRLDIVLLSYFSLFLPQDSSLSILSVLKSLIKK